MYLEACVMYFVNATVDKRSENGLSLDAFLNNTPSGESNFGENLFWLLPGIKYSLS